MNTKWFALAGSLLLAGVCSAKEHNDYQKGTLLRMESSPCGMQEKGGKSMTGEILGTDSQSKKTKEVLCQEYVLQAEKVIYRIRDRKSTRLNSSHVEISYAVFCLKKKKQA